MKPQKPIQVADRPALKILIVSDYRDKQASRPEAELFIYMHAQGIAISVETYPCWYADRMAAEGLPVSTKLTTKKFSPTFIRYLRQRLRREQFDILYLFPNQAIINGLFSAIGHSVKVFLYRGYTGNVHWYDPIAYLKFLSPRVDKIICIADSVRVWLESQPTFKKGKAVTIHKGHDAQWYQGHDALDLNTFSIPPGSVVMACMANARPFKGIRYLLEATYQLADLENLHLLLIGRDMDAKELQSVLRDSPMRDRIHLTGYRNDVLSILKSCDFFVLPSIGGEAITKSLIEAMSMGLPAAITNIAGNRSLVDHEKNGLVVPIKDPTALAGAIRRLATDESLRKDLGIKARDHIHTHFSIEETVEKTLKVFYDAL